MKILIVGSGGREHALAWKIKQSPLCMDVFVAPGNAGTAAVATNIALSVDDFVGLGDFCKKEGIGLVVVGPEVPLVKGIRDYFENDPTLSKVLMVGPGKEGAQLEGSKDFSKKFMERHGIPTAKAQAFQADQLEDALQYIGQCSTPIVLKADGLASGKGVIICEGRDEARETLRDMLIGRKFGEAGARVLVETFLQGIELSVFVLTDGTDYVVLPEAKDYKRIRDNDEGPNTGGMGAVSPVVFADAQFLKKVEEKVIKPTVRGLQQEGIPYKGFIFIGLMNVGGEPFVIEYNVRMGDPETQAVMPRIKSDLVELFMATALGKLKGKALEKHTGYAVTVVQVSGGYPDHFEKGKGIRFLNEGAGDKALVFHAGTKEKDGVVFTDGGRVMAITGLGENLDEARKQAYERSSKITWDKQFYRKDIGLDLLQLMQKKVQPSV